MTTLVFLRSTSGITAAQVGRKGISRILDYQKSDVLPGHVGDCHQDSKKIPDMEHVHEGMA